MPGSDFASDRVAADPAPFDGKQAITYLKKICDIGPRISGTEGMAKQQELITKHFTDLGAKVELQKFTARQGRRDPIEMANIIVSWHPEQERRVIFCSHYDTRPIADQEENMERWRKPFVSANDGGSGVALLMELGHHMKNLNCKIGVDFVFFDGEEYIWDSKTDVYFFGSKHFAETYRDERKKQKTKVNYTAAILLDMVGGKNAKFPIEPNSWYNAAGVVRSVWGVAQELKVTSFRNEQGQAVEDDHLPLNRIGGIPAIDIIDFDYKHWHRLTDTPDNCSAESLEQVAKVLSVWVQRLK
jgi:hypothetical protein